MTEGPAPQPISFLARLWSLPVFRPFVFGWFDVPPPLAVISHAPAPPPMPCSISPLPEIDEDEAQVFEANVGTDSIVNLDGLTPATSKALQRFQNVVGSVGGSITLKSAFRPSSYQEHLQAVWDKQTLLRINTEPGCRDLKDQVAEEFERHDLLLTQRPVKRSDHTLGIGFDAAVSVPSGARLNRRRVTLDSLARRAGVVRPDVRRDPVHFRLIGGRRLS